MKFWMLAVSWGLLGILWISGVGQGSSSALRTPYSSLIVSQPSLANPNYSLLPQSKRCPKGHVNSADRKVCKECGAKLPATVAIITIMVCSKNGLLATSYCPLTKSKRVAKNSVPKSCTTHIQLQNPAIRIESKVNDKGIEMMRVPAGEFTMGSNDRKDETPIRKVYLDEYWIGKTEVTVAQFRKFCDASGYTYDWSKNKPKWGWLDDHPMVIVTWHEASAFCNWAGGGLPTEAQWEKAARGPNALKFPWGNEWDGGKCQCSKTEAADAKRTAPVGSFPRGASPFGCLDMAGNVAEWCADWYENYDASKKRNPQGPLGGYCRMLRGGSWPFNDSVSFRSTDRHNNDPTALGDYYGFRLASR